MKSLVTDTSVPGFFLRQQNQPLVRDGLAHRYRSSKRSRNYERQSDPVGIVNLTYWISARALAAGGRRRKRHGGAGSFSD
jgi:hypothetical protein